jgi:hypothetical protein
MALRWTVRKGGRKMARGIVSAIVVTAAVMAFASPALAQFGLGSQAPSIPPTGKVLGCAGGRYVFGQVSDSSKDQYMLDTQTGRLWRIGESSDVGTHLRVIPYKDEQGKVSPCPADMPGVKAEKGKKN